MAAAERVVKHAVFSYVDPDGVYRTALRGQTISVDGDELARGERFDVFFDEDDDAAVASPLDGALVGDDEDLDDDELDSGTSPGGAEPTPLDEAAAEATDELDSTGTVAESDEERPARTANKAAWLDFRGLGDLTEEQANAVTLKELQDDAFMSSYQRPTA
jgi:intein/homing endonuclease